MWCDCGCGWQGYNLDTQIGHDTEAICRATLEFSIWQPSPDTRKISAIGALRKTMSAVASVVACFQLFRQFADDSAATVKLSVQREREKAPFPVFHACANVHSEGWGGCLEAVP